MREKVEEAEATPVTVAYLGPEASYCHQAALQQFPNRATHTLLAQPSIADCFSAVRTSTASLAVVPIENSSNGAVTFTLDLFLTSTSSPSSPNDSLWDVFVTAETFIPILHCLLGPLPPPSTTPPSSSPYAHIKNLYTHPQAWGQCTQFLSSDSALRTADRHDTSSTSRAAAIAAADPSRSSAAIASALAGKVSGLPVLAECINDRVDNVTRFYVLRRRRRRQQQQQQYQGLGQGQVPQDGGGDDDDENAEIDGNNEGKSKVLAAFTVDHGNPGALAAALAVFARHDSTDNNNKSVNLTSINSRPSGAPWTYNFFVEIECQGSEGRRAVDEALGELRGRAKSCRKLGMWKV